MDRLESGAEPLTTFLEEREAWLGKPAARHEAWLRAVLSGLCQWNDLLVTGTELPSRLTVDVPEHGITLRPWGALFAPKADRGADAPLALVHQVTPGTPLRSVPEDGWAASSVDRLATALRRLDIPIGVVTDGRWWTVVWAVSGSATGSGMFDAATWGEEPLLRDAFAGLVGVQRLVGVREDERLPALFADSLLAQEEITEALGTQVRRAVELLVQAFSEARLEAHRTGAADPLPESPREVYDAAVTVLMRVVFLLFAEERGLLPIDRDLYRNSYAVSVLLDELEERARAGEELLDDSSGAWHRLLAVSRAVHDGASFEDVRMPAYGGSLFRPGRFAWFEAVDESGGLRLRVSDRVVLHLLRAVQVVTTGGQARRVSFREVDVEQIGYVYEGLLGYTARETRGQVVLGLKGKQGAEPEIEHQHHQQNPQRSSTPEAFAAQLATHLDTTQPGSKGQTKNQIAKAFASEVDEAEIRSGLLAACQHDESIVRRVLPFVPLFREDLRGLPYVVPSGGLVVAETASRRNAGAHYTPRALAEEVVLHALEPLVYAPGPLQTADRDEWKLKGSAEILDLKVADIAAGSGAFLVAAARYLALRLVEAWRAEEAIPDVVQREGDDGSEDPLLRLAMREVIARCLYGADINEMAVEMCKLSLWLVSLDPDKPFSFVNDKILLGNSLLGLTTVDQLRGLHIAPSPQRLRNPGFTIDVEADLEKAAKLRREIASSPVDDLDPQRSAAHKAALLEQTRTVTTRLRDVADGVVAAGLALGGKPGRPLDSAYENLSFALLQAFPPDGSEGERSFLETVQEKGLTPTVPTDYERWEPLHWIVEVPDVMERGGFDAVIGNPPFLGSRFISGAVGDELREWLTCVIASERKGLADLITFFLLRATALTAHGAFLGLVTKDSIASSENRRVGLGPLLESGFTVYRAVTSRNWPSQGAHLRYAVVWGTFVVCGEQAQRVLDGSEVNVISSALTSDLTRTVELVELPANGKMAFVGVYPNGEAFRLPPEEAQALIRANPRNSEVVKPYLRSEDIHKQIDFAPTQWIMDFGARTAQEAGTYPEVWATALTRVKPERSTQKQPRLRDVWWQFKARASAMNTAIANLDHVLVVPQDGKALIPVRIHRRNDVVIDTKLVVIASDSFALFALLSSSIHRAWVVRDLAAMDGSLKYLPRAFATFPLPSDRELRSLDPLGRELGGLQESIMRSQKIGLRELYNRVNSSGTRGGPEISSLRELHGRIDEAVAGAYGWSDLRASTGFFDMGGVTHFSIDPQAKAEVLSRLIQLNQAKRGGSGR
jgi:hypothetical protein